MKAEKAQPASSLGRYPEVNFLAARKADDLTEQEVQSFFVEPLQLLHSTLGLRQHFMLVGGRGAGKTITLRKLSHNVSPLSDTFPFFGIYVTLNLSECAAFTDEKIGPKNGALFESFLSGLLIEQLLHGLGAYIGSVANEQDLARQISWLLRLPSTQPATIADLAFYVATQTSEMRNVADIKLTSARLSDLPSVYTFAQLNSICGALAHQLSVPASPVVTLLLLDHYGDMPAFQQSVANCLFNLSAPRNFYVRASIKPFTVKTTEMYTGGSINEPQDFRTIDLESLLDFDTYQELLCAIVNRRLAAASHSWIRDSKPLPELPDILAGPTRTGEYAGFETLASLSDGNIFNFLYLIEKCVDSFTLQGFLSGSQVSAETQHTAARQVADICFDGIAIEGDKGVVKHLTRSLLQVMKDEHLGPVVRFKQLREDSAERFVRLALTESVFKRRSIPSVSLDDVEIELNRILFPRKELPLEDQQPLELDLATFKSIIKQAETVRTRKHHGNEQQQSLWPQTGTSETSVAYMHTQTPAAVEAGQVSRFLRDQRKNADFLLKSLDFSSHIIAEATTTLQQRIFEQFEATTVANLTVGLAGSFARGEAVTGHSDADLFVAGFIGQSDLERAYDLLDFCSEWFSNKGITAPPAKRVQSAEEARHQPFPCLINVSGLVERTAQPKDSDKDRSRRMCLVTEGTGIFNMGVFDTCRTTILKRLDTYDYIQNRTVPASLFREFLHWCGSFLSRIEVDGKVGLKYEKRKLQRLFMQRATLLGCKAHISQGNTDDFDRLLDIFQLPPIIRLYHVNDSVSGSLKDEVGRLVGDALDSYNTALGALVTVDSSILDPTRTNIERQAETTLWAVLDRLEQIISEGVGTRHQQAFVSLGA